MNKKEPLRMCIACREMKNKKDLLRIVKNKEGKIFVDETGKANGRGAYICKDTACLEKLKKQKVLNKAFKMMIEESVYEEIKGAILGRD
jgi:predicted RNA-binding protein YlxR (DUF448 family)